MARVRFAEDQWFFEETERLGEPSEPVWGLLPETEVFSQRTPFQQIEIFDSKQYGRVLVLDGLIQLTTRYEFVYHEMLVHPAMFYHANPKKVLVIGGGDGGVLRELTKHPLETVEMIEIDREVVDAAKTYLPSVCANAFEDPRVRVIFDDAVKSIEPHREVFDIAIVDGTDCFGPSAPLWQKSFFERLLRSLKPGGVASFQTGYFKEGFAKTGRAKIKSTFPFSIVHRAHVGCYPFDECSFTMASRAVDFSLADLRQVKARYERSNIPTCYYSPDIHFASTVMPKHILASETAV